jgi:LysR family transcriptional regulator, regulator of abg operon
VRLVTLEALILVESLGSLRAVGQRMGLSQPALTVAIQQLEQELQAPLLVRSSQGVGFTSFGRAFLHHAKVIVNQSRRASDEIAQMRGLAQGTVSLAISPAIGLALLPQALRQFSRQHPRIRVQCRDGLYPGVASLLREGSIDFALTPVHRDDLDSDLVADAIFSSEIVIIAPRTHPLAGATSLAELRDCDWVLSTPARGSGALIEEAFSKAGLGQLRVRMLCESFLALPGIVAASGDWFSTMPRIVFENCAVRSQLARVPVQHELPRPTVCTVRRHDVPLTSVAQQLVAWVQHYASVQLQGEMTQA